MLIACWSKSIVQAELARYIITSGDTYIRALNRIPGHLPGPKGPLSWPLLLGLIAFVPGVTGMAGIMGAAGQALDLLIGIGSVPATGIVACATMAILWSGSYLTLERTMLTLVMTFTAVTLISASLMQLSDDQMTMAELSTGLQFLFPTEFAVLALATYGYIGVNANETSAYTYWCVEKGYPSFIGADDGDAGWADRAKGWIRVMQTDVWATLLILTFATVPFYLLGAGVLNRHGLMPEGLETISVLSSMFTATFGEWSLWLFGTGAFFILFSTCIASAGAGGRYLPEYAIELGFVDRLKVHRRLWTRLYTGIVPLLGFIIYAFTPRPITLVAIAASVGALMLPVQSGLTLYLQHRHLDVRVTPGIAARYLLKGVFVFQCLMALAVIYFVLI